MLADLRVNGAEGPIDNVFAAGDCAAVPDLASGEGKFCPPNAQHAVRQGKRIELDLDDDTSEAQVTEMCEKLLANTVIESYRIELEG